MSEQQTIVWVLIAAGAWLLFAVALLVSVVWLPIRDRRKYRTGKWGARGEQWSRRPWMQGICQAAAVAVYFAMAVALNVLLGGWIFREWSAIFLVIFAVASILHMLASGQLYEIIRFGRAFLNPGGPVWFAENPVGFCILTFVYVWGCMLAISFAAAVAGYVLFAGVPI